MLGCTVLVSFLPRRRRAPPAATGAAAARDLLELVRGIFFQDLFQGRLLWIRRVRRNGELLGVTGEAVSTWLVAALGVIHSPSISLPGIHFIHKNSLLPGSTLVLRESAG